MARPGTPTPHRASRGQAIKSVASFAAAGQDSEVSDYRADKKIYILSQELNFSNRFPRQALKKREGLFSAMPMNQCNF